MIALAVVIGAVSAPKGAQTQSSASLSADASGWAKKNYAQYEDFLDDDADLFDDDAIETFAKYDAQLDYGYGSILGLVSTDSLDGKSMEDYAMDASADLELGDSDMLLLMTRTPSSGTLPMEATWRTMLTTTCRFSSVRTSAASLPAARKRA